MNIYNFVKSELKVTAGENLDISSDLEQHQTNNIRELLVNEEKKEEKNDKDQKENTSEK